MEDHDYDCESSSSTILDILNQDCWRLILDQLHIIDILQSERVSRQWQQMILQYLQGARFNIEYPNYKQTASDHLRTLLMSEEDQESSDRIIRKWGSFVKKMDCVDKVTGNGVRDIGKHCCNLEDIAVTDECVSLWLTDTIEELAIEDARLVTGLCLTTLQSTNLRSLSLKNCKALESRHILSVFNHLTRLKKLELRFLPKEVFQNAHYLLDKTTEIEDLGLGWSESIELGTGLVESVAQLGRLRRLDLSFNMNANDEWLEVIARNCRLEELLVERCLDVTGRGVLAVCRTAGPAMRSLHVGSSRTIGNRDVVSFISACPNLTSVEVSYNYEVTEDLVHLAAEAARPRPLRLQVESTMIEGHEADLYPWVELDFGPPGIRDYDSSSS